MRDRLTLAAKTHGIARRYLSGTKHIVFPYIKIVYGALVVLVLGLFLAIGACSRDFLQTNHSYDGTRATILEIGDEDNLETYTIDLVLRAATPEKDKPEYGEQTPAMPFRAGRAIAVYHIGNGYLILIRDASNENVIQTRVGDSIKPTRITIAASTDGVFLYVNGGEAARSATPAARLSGTIRVGAGYKKRFWRGDFRYFDVYNNLQTLGEFAPDADRFGGAGRILTLDLK